MLQIDVAFPGNCDCVSSKLRLRFVEIGEPFPQMIAEIFIEMFFGLLKRATQVVLENQWLMYF